MLPKRDSTFWSLADQALVSGSNFFCGILLARVLGLEAFGAYVVAQTYLLYANTFQGALVVSSMMTAVPVEKSDLVRRALLRGFFGYSLLVFAGTTLLIQCAALLFDSLLPSIGLGPLALALAVAMAGFQIQDWLRRACYVETKTHTVFVADCIAYGGQFLVLAILASLQRLSAESALWCMATSFSISALTLVYSTKLWPDFRNAFAVAKQFSHASGDFFASWQLQWLASQGVILFGTAVVGQQAAGAIRAAQNLLGPVNVVFQWMDNVIPVRAAIRLRDGGRGALATYLWRLAVLGSLALGLFVAALTFVDEPLIVLLYGEAYRPFAVLVVFQALYYLFGHAYRVASYFRRAIQETRELAIASAWWAATAMLAAALTVNSFSERGVMFSLVVGELAGLIYLVTRRQAKSKQQSHCILRRRDGSPQLLLPTASRKHILATLGLYFPSRWTGHAYRTLLSWVLPIQVQLRLVEVEPHLSKSYPHLDAVLRMFPELEQEQVGILVGAPGPRSKLTLKLMDKSANVLAYARLAYGERAIAAIRQEATILELVTKKVVGTAIPKVLRTLEFQDPEAFCIVESAGPELPAQVHLTVLHFEFLAQLVTTGTVTWHETIAALRAEVANCFEGEDELPVCMNACTALTAAPNHRLPTCIEHGDFAPWNIRRDEKGQLFVLDWEHGRPDGIPWLDALHFEYQMAVLVRRLAPAHAKDVLLRVFTGKHAQQYARQCEIPENFRRSLVILYLLRMIVVAHSEGATLKSHSQQIRMAVLRLLVPGNLQRDE